MSDFTPTVTIQTKNGPVLINESDFDSKTMKLAGDPEPVAPTEPPAAPAPVAPTEPPAAPAPVAPTEQLLVMKSGGKFFITNTLGAKVEGEAAAALGIDAEGYTTEAKAKAALAAITKA